VTHSLRRVALVLFVLFAALFVNLNYLQVLRADDLAGDNRNTRTLIKEYELRRGSILVGQGDAQAEIAKSVETEGRYKYERRYPDGQLYAHITGFYSVVYGRAGLEESVNDVLIGGAAEEALRNFGDFLSGREREGDDVALTIDPAVQKAAREGLGDKVGAVVAIQPQTGALLAVYANPTYDPNELSTFDQGAATKYWERTEDDRRNRALRELYPPGSTFKLVTAAAALEDGMSPDKTFPDPQSYTPPQTTVPIGNFGGGLCNGGAPLTLTQALAVSCNTVFARLGNQVGPDKLVAQAERFGINQRWDSQVSFAPSSIPEELDAPAAAQSAIGQRDVRVTPLQMAMVAAAIGNDGVLVRPHIIDQVQDFNGRVIREYTPSPLEFADAAGGAAVSPRVADDLQAMMEGVVTGGSGTAAALPGVDVAGKTGTAQVAEGQNPTVWFVGFAPADNPTVAVAVVVPDGGDVGAEATGGAVAAPIARQVMEAALR
jgi:peptidoglycan glycosyltransferase